MELRLKREISTDLCTVGKLYLDNVFFCYTLEDAYHEVKIKGQTRISAGRYEIKPRYEGGMIERYKERFGKDHFMLWLQNITDFEYIYIHPGNFIKNTDGCLLVGERYTKLSKSVYVSY